eukprot:scaffold141633_cov31-Tisochrysis_lutea.AAC.2
MAARRWSATCASTLSSHARPAEQREGARGGEAIAGRADAIARFSLLVFTAYVLIGRSSTGVERAPK